MRALALALLLGGCTSADVMCNAVQSDLSRCGLPVEGLDCPNVDYGALASLQGRLKSGTCDVAEGDGVDPRLCALAGWSCPGSPTPVLAGVPVNALVLVGGIDDSAVFDWNPDIAAALTAAGVEAHHVSVVPWQTIPVRAADLAGSLDALTRRTTKKLDLVCYAVAGLDCRYLVSPKGLYASDPTTRAEVISHIASITTISTPHRGTRVADAAIVALQTSTVSDVLQTLFGVNAPEVLPDSSQLLGALHGLTLDALWDFDARTPDEPSVYGQSFAGVSTPFGQVSDSVEADAAKLCVDDKGAPAYQRHAGTVDPLDPLLLLSAPFSHTARDAAGIAVSSPSDGMIPLVSASWAHFRGCLPADHYDVIGQVGEHTRDPLTGFAARDFYVWLAADLAGRGL